MVLALAREVGELRLAVAPQGALEIPARGRRSAAAPRSPSTSPRSAPGLGLAVFTSEGCGMCRALEPAVAAFERDPRVVLRRFDEVDDADAWALADVPGSPFAVAVGADGTVLAKGTFNSGAPARVGARRRRAPAGGGECLSALSDRVAGGTLAPRLPRARGRRRDGAGRRETAALAGQARRGRGVPLLRAHLHDRLLPAPDRAAADRLRGYPLRARDGNRVDDLGRLVDRGGDPVDEDGRRLTDPDGRPLPRAPRTPVCKVVARRYGFRTQIDGAWYRCCGGKVRKLVDCCAYTRSRINGDAALTGYCYNGRKVFCVMYFQTKVSVLMLEAVLLAAGLSPA